VKPTDIAHLITLGPPTVSPDGRHVVVAASRPDLERDEYRSQLWIADTDAATPPRALTHGDRDTAPRYAPDGRHLAFLRAESGAKPQLWLLPTGGGEARRLTDLPGGAGPAAWAPDSTRLAFSARVEPEKGASSPEKEPPRRITGLQYHLDGVGYTFNRRPHLFVLDLSEDEPTDGGPSEGGPATAFVVPRQLTDGDFDDTDPAWSPDGRWLAFASARHPDREHDRYRDLFLIGSDGSGLRRLTDTSLGLAKPAFTPDGNTVLALGSDPQTGSTRRWQGRNTGLFAIDLDARGRARRLTDEESINVAGEHLWVEAGHATLTVEQRGAVQLISVPLDGGPPTVLAEGHQQITGFDIAPGPGLIAVTVTDDTTPGEVGVLFEGRPRLLTDFAFDLRARAQLPAMTEIGAQAPDGYPVHGFLVTPDGPGPHPVLLLIHGGPFAQYGWTLLDEVAVYAAAGYAVVYGNPRGSSGYGQAHGDAIHGDVGARSAADLLALLDASLARPDLDQNRVGVLGGSHGGFMTTWLVGHTDRFAAAISERAVNAIDSFTGSSDIGWDFAADLYGPDPDGQRRQSPLSSADAITTPLLIVHSEQDWRCPIEQAQRLYVRLAQRGAEVEMLLFPGEGHELSRTGLPSHRVARFEAIIDWFGRYLH
jgi:dipeptidyl aminopeptidase/acylaminoacyl peptidase